jgi:hypothetical protein
MELRRFFLYGARPYRSRAHMKILQQITPELFSEFLTAKNTKQFCLSCGRLQLFVPHTTIHKVDPIHQSILMPMTGVMLRQTQG